MHLSDDHFDHIISNIHRFYPQRHHRDAKSFVLSPHPQSPSMACIRCMDCIGRGERMAKVLDFYKPCKLFFSYPMGEHITLTESQVSILKDIFAMMEI